MPGGHQEAHDVCDLLRLGEAALRNPSERVHDALRRALQADPVGFGDPLVEAPGALGADAARTDCVDAHTLGGEFCREALAIGAQVTADTGPGCPISKIP